MTSGDADKTACNGRDRYGIPCRVMETWRGAYGRIYATLKGTGRSSRRRFADLLIAATALAHALPLYTRNPGDFTGLEGLIDINAV